MIPRILIVKGLALFLGLSSSALARQSITFQLDTGKSGQKVELASEITYWQTNAIPLKEVSAGRYSVSIPSPWLHQLAYKFIVDGKWIADPANAERAPDGFGGVNSIRHVEFQEDPLLDPPNGDALIASELKVRDWEGDTRVIKLLRPRTTAGRRLVVIYFNDGDGYLEYASIANLMANLSKEPNMPAFAGVFLNAKDRDREYYANDDYARFVARTVVPAAERALGARVLPTERLVIGISLGGLISFYITLKHPDVFPYVASQSGSLWFEPERMHHLLRGLQGRDLKFFIQMGLYDESDMISSSREMATTLREMGFDAVHLEFPGTHDWIPWRNLLQRTFRFFFERPPRY